MSVCVCVCACKQSEGMHISKQALACIPMLTHATCHAQILVDAYTYAGHVFALGMHSCYGT